MNKNGNYHLCLSVFYLTVILVGKTLGKEIRQKIFPKNGKRMKMVQNFVNLAVQELPYHLKYRSFGSPMLGCLKNFFLNITKRPNLSKSKILLLLLMI